MKVFGKKSPGGEKGSVMMESIILLPFVLIALMAAIQFAHIFFARQITEYAAFCAARAGRVGFSESIRNNAFNAAKQICSIISLSAPSGSTGVLYALPWLGEVPGSQALESKLAVNCSSDIFSGQAFAAEVTMHFPLVVPVVNQFISGLFKFRDEVHPLAWQSPLQEGTFRSYSRTFENDIFPHIVITRKALVPANPALAD